MDLGDLTAKAEAFGWFAVDADGHDPASIFRAIDACKAAGRPAFINLHTIKAKGWAQYEGQVASHWVGSVTKDGIAEAVALLQAEIQALDAAV